MPTSDGRLYSFKYVNGHPKNTAAGLLTVTAFGVLADVQTGYPLLLSELTVTTALRTAAMSALAARHLARPNSRVMALIGNGAQSEFQAIGFHRMLGIRELRLFDTDPKATAKLEQNLRAMPELDDLKIVRATSSAEACKGADIVTTVTADKRNAVILTPPMIAPGMHLNAVGGDCPGKTELHPDLLRMADLRVFVEYEPQSRIEGEIQQMPSEYPGDGIRRPCARHGAWAHGSGRDHGVRFGRVCTRGLFRAAVSAFSAEGRAGRLRGKSIWCPNSTIRRICLAVRWDGASRRASASRHEYRREQPRLSDRRTERYRRRYPRSLDGAGGPARRRHPVPCWNRRASMCAIAAICADPQIPCEGRWTAIDTWAK